MKRTIPVLATVAVASLTLAGCAAGPAAQASGVSIVASTSVYGDIASSIVGDLGTVTSIISDSAVDPHSFEASARDQLAIADADLVIANGGGYDPFVEALVEASGSKAIVIQAVDASGLLDHDDAADHDEAQTAEEPAADDDGHDDGSTDDGSTDDGGHAHIEGFNEHVWYSLHGMTHVIENIADELGTIDPANVSTFDANAAALLAQVEELESRESTLTTEFAGGGAAVTEPVPVYMLEAVGLENLTPSDFTEAIEEGNDVPPLALEDTLELFTSGGVRVLAYNEQTASPETERVRQAAEASGIPVVQFTETLPQGADYISWMSDNLDALSAALQP
ncbi:MAG: zinc ABC transporter substrate-binding protein [Salinibacterium sp.]|nr:zinc ABC transporter substrate-binding protein [Salinibacterium sp.]